MKVDQVLTAALLLLLPLASCLQVVTVTDDRATLNKLVASLPSCMIPCAASHAPRDCPPTTMKCVCRPPNKAVEECSVKQCNGWDLVVGKRLIMEACGVPPPREDIPLMAQLWASTAVCMVALGMCIAARLLGGQGGIGWDDACVTGAICCLVITVSGTQVAVGHGLGRDAYDTVDDLNVSTRWFFIRSIFFFWAVAACKASLLFQFSRIFNADGADPEWRLLFRGPAWSFRMVVLCTHMVNLISCLSFTIFALAQCDPMSYYWTQWNSPRNGSCIVNKRYPSFGHSIVGVLLDFWILGLPLTLISTLNMSKGTKIAAASMYCLGALLAVASVTVISIIRVIILMKDLNISSDLLSNYTAVTKWSQAEMATAIVCACIIPAKQFCFRVLPLPFRRLKKALISARRPRRSLPDLENSSGEEGGVERWQHEDQKPSAGGVATCGKHGHTSSTVSKDGEKSVVVDASARHCEASAGRQLPAVGASSRPAGNIIARNTRVAVTGGG
ncbi:uncharacterized protein PpBr36_10274 [Pyricularia pennisetigena]|uniref:uncharacterized protein n=1 Tax=Pyricularia pennisetigena TaxID=1578925 RepID=UPI001153A3E0|nr:uncharacterized protein PpBr36_10274 [Pyricularia pennisetigena]TLS21531.1 hypothetical protein PpBr36_10274 [Pyricularia pennisetigena]